MMGISLRNIDHENWRKCVRLKVAEDQRSFVADNAVSLAQASYEPEHKLVPLAVYHNDEMVGFAMYGQANFEGQDLWVIFRLMMDRAHQGKGYGRAAMLQIIERMKTIPGCDSIYISFVPENIAAQKLYASLGFVDTGLVDEGEIVYRLAL